MTCIMPCLFGFSAPHLGERVIQEHAQRGGEERRKEGGGEGGSDRKGNCVLSLFN